MRGGVNSHKEDRGVVANHVPVTLVGVKLDGKAARVTSSVTATFLTTDGREASKDRGFGARFLQKVGRCQLGQVSSDLCAVDISKRKQFVNNPTKKPGA